MGDHSLFDWVSVMGPILFSWPLIIGIALLIFYQPIFKLLEKVSVQDVQKAKIGPLEIEETEDPYAESLTLLLTSFVSEDELKQMQRLDTQTQSASYNNASNLVSELKRLHTLGFITAKTNLDQLPEDGDLKQHIELSSKGKTYLSLREKLLAKRSEEEES